MTIYKPIYDHGHKVVALDRDKMKPLGRTKSFTEGGYGTVYENPFYTSEEDVWKYWRGDYVPQERLIYLRGVEA